MRYIHLSVGKPFLAVARAFLTQVTRTALCCCCGRNVHFPGARRAATWNSHHLETSSYTIVYQECPSYKPSKGRTIRFKINPNKQHLSFSSFYYWEGPPCETSIGQSFLNHNFPLLYLLWPYLHCSSSTSIATRMNSEWWLCSKRMSLDHGPKCNWPKQVCRLTPGASP
jgi:hypothetical protein